MLDIDRQDDIVRFTMNQPEIGNALGLDMIAGMRDELARLREDESVRFVTLTGAGKIFSAGANLKDMKRIGEASPEDNLRDAVGTAGLFASLHSFPRPVLAIVNGPARGGGVGLVASCDFALLSENANFAFTEVRLGLIPAMISPFVIGKMGVSRARKLFLSGVKFDARQAVEWGLGDDVAPPEELEERASEMIGSLRASSPDAVARIKALVRDVADPAITDIGRHTAELIAAARSTEDAREGMSAFLEKRPPKWET